MYQKDYEFAGIGVTLRTQYPQVHDLCRDYRSSRIPELTVTVTRADIDYERTKGGSGYTDAYLETLAAYRLLGEALVDRDVLLVHGSAIAVDGKGYLFTAPSGTGKSTHAALWRQLLGSRAVAVNDDKPLVALRDGRAWVYGTPWDGKHRRSTNICVPLAGICLLRRGQENRICGIPAREGYPALLGQILRPRTPEGLARMLRLTESLAECAELFSLECTPDIRAAEIAWEEMKGAAR